MAGMLPGVEAARRRRVHQKSNLSDLSPTTSGCSSRRPSFSLYASSHDFHFCTSNSSMVRNASGDESRLGAEAREAKRRLDERLQAHWTARSKIGEARLRSPSLPEDQAAETPKLKKSGSKRLRWLNLSWKSAEQEECAVCLEQLKAAPPPETLTQLACGHRFHRNCLLPWVEANGHCPCCRFEISSPISRPN